MQTTLARCLAGSTVFHGVLLGLLVFAPGFSRPPKEDSLVVETLTFIPPNTRILDQEVNRITAPQPENPKPPEANVPPPEQASPSSPPPKPEPVQKPDVTVRRETKREEPPPTGKQEPKIKIGSKPIQPETPDKSEPAGPATPAKSKIQVTKNPIKVTPSAVEEKPVKKPSAAEIAAREEAETREWLAREKERQNRTANRASRLDSIASKLQSNLAPSADIQLPAGSESYASYYSVLKTIYERAWSRRRPDSISQNMLIVQAAITIARDGNILSTRIIEPSGITSMDRSVDRVLRDVTKVPPFPEGAKDTERTITISFKVEGASDT